MKIFGVTNNYLSSSPAHLPTDSPDYFLIPDSSLLKSGKPFFIPDENDSFRAMPSLAVKICRLGKGISPKFAGRYYNEFASGALFFASKKLEILRLSGKPLTPALAFDYNAPLSSFFPKDELQDNFNFTISVSEGETAIWELSGLIKPIDSVISIISKNNTLKTGDIIFVGFPDYSIELQANSRFTIDKHGALIYRSNIK